MGPAQSAQVCSFRPIKKPQKPLKASQDTTFLVTPESGALFVIVTVLSFIEWLLKERY